MVKINDKVLVNGVESTVETQWGAGVHLVSKLSDGRLINDLHKLIEAGKASIVLPVVVPKTMKLPELPRDWKFIKE